MVKYDTIHTGNLKTMLRQFENLYPESLQDFNPFDLNSYKRDLKNNIKSIYTLVCEQYPGLLELVNQFIQCKDKESLQKICEFLFRIFPIATDEKYHPMQGVMFQTQRYLQCDFNRIGDCKLLTLLCAYICNSLANIPVLISVRPYNGHPVLYLGLPFGVHKVSFRYGGPVVKPFKGEIPIDLRRKEEFDLSFSDSDFRAGEELSILYGDVLGAFYVLDAINILRRCVVNYSTNPEYYRNMFYEQVKLLGSIHINTEQVITYWQAELDRVEHLFLDPRVNCSTQRFKELVISSLRFTEQ